MSRAGQSWPDTDLQPCGTPAAYRRHFRRGEPPCPACADADSRRRGHLAETLPDTREVRNGLPAFKPYVYGATRRRP